MNRLHATEVLQYVRTPALPGVEVLIANPSLYSWRMLHQRYLLCGCTSVSTSWRYRGKVRHIEDGQTAFMEPGEIHQVIKKRKPAHFWALFIEPADLHKFAGEFGVSGAIHFARTEAHSPSFLRNLQALSRCLQSGTGDLELQSLLVVLLREALQHAEAQPKPGHLDGQALARSLQRAQEILHTRFSENVSLDELASAAGLSRFHLVRSFTARYGSPPHSYLIHLRVKRSCQLLRTGASCAEAASAVGFADQSHFTRHFKKVMRVPPRKYLRSV